LSRLLVHKDLVSPALEVSVRLSRAVVTPANRPPPGPPREGGGGGHRVERERAGGMAGEAPPWPGDGDGRAPGTPYLPCTAPTEAQEARATRVAWSKKPRRPCAVWLKAPPAVRLIGFGRRTD
jgi:hypothetical protein